MKPRDVCIKYINIDYYIMKKENIDPFIVNKDPPNCQSLKGNLSKGLRMISDLPSHLSYSSHWMSNSTVNISYDGGKFEISPIKICRVHVLRCLPNEKEGAYDEMYYIEYKNKIYETMLQDYDSDIFSLNIYENYDIVSTFVIK